jgi:predicted phage terminase large subunit-like protein
LRKAERLAGVLQALGHQFPVDRPDDADLYESSLRNFYEGMWPVIEPKTPFRGNWHLDAICEHLEYAVVRRQILQLLINMPPRFSKSTLCSVALPAYIWSMFPHIRWLYASYAQSLSTRDSVLCRRVIQSPWYQARWGHVFRLTTDQNIKQRYENDRTGARIATSVGAALTGEGGDVLVCFPREALVLTERGPVPIGDIVEQRQRVRVWSVDGDGRQVLRRVVGWKKNPGADMVRVDFGNGHAVCCTGDHRLMTSSGWVEALSLAPGDVLPCFSLAEAYAAIPAQRGRLEYAGVDEHAGPGPSFDNTGDAADLSVAGHHVKPLKADDVSPLGVCWCGHRESSYCLTVEHDHNFMVNVGGAKYIIAANCDDAHNVVEAESDAARKGAVDWFNSSMSTRLNDAKTGVKIVVMQRVHQDDLAGHLLETGDWYHLCLPMEFEGVKPQWVIGWTDPREKEGELLWPERYGPDEVARLKRALGSYGAAAQLQQRPTPRGGGIFKGSWFGSYKAAPEFVRIVESWDTATSEKEHAAYSVGTAWGETVNGDILLLDVSRGRWDFPRLKAEVAFFHAKHRGSVILVEDKSSGRQVCQELGRDVRLPILPVSVGKSDKASRAITVSPMVEAGKVKLPEDAPWLADYMEEMLLFPNSRNADQVDSTTQALAYMRNGGVTARMDMS